MAKAASLIRSDKLLLPDGGIIQIRIWRLPTASIERPHGLKYSLFYGRPGIRIVGYDNEAGKGDHRHHHGREEAYVFTSLEKLIDDFMRDVIEELANDGTPPSTG
jgi:hypothetical protein